jgi:hypothetical protein
MLIKILAVVGVIIALVLLILAFTKKEYAVQREVTISK